MRNFAYKVATAILVCSVGVWHFEFPSIPILSTKIHIISFVHVRIVDFVGVHNRVLFFILHFSAKGTSFTFQ
jgi:hypothetical protein